MRLFATTTGAPVGGVAAHAEGGPPLSPHHSDSILPGSVPHAHSWAGTEDLYDAVDGPPPVSTEGGVGEEGGRVARTLGMEAGSGSMQGTITGARTSETLRRSVDDALRAAGERARAGDGQH
jgi:hypothetical protein